MSRIFGMVTTEASRQYTPKAVESFFAYTELEESENLLLIDNDGSVPELPFPDRINVVTNPEPRGFAQNLNFAIQAAKGHNADVYFLNNDLIFTRDWIVPLLPVNDAIITPVSNREFQYVKDGLRCERFLTLEQFGERYEELDIVAAHHRAKRNGYQSVFTLPFFCVKIPPKVYGALGPVDESFGMGGAEDNDYCIRAHLNGLKVVYAMHSFILHFSGKSTWHGAETPEQTQVRDNHYIERFDKKWGPHIRRLSIQSDLSVLVSSPEMIKAFRQGDFSKIIKTLNPNAEALGAAARS